jgi:hypothetical protein
VLPPPDHRFLLKTRRARNPLRSFSQNLILGVQMAPSHRETHKLRWGAKPPTSIDGFPGGEGPFGPPKSGFEKNFSKGWVAAKGPPRDGTGTRSLGGLPPPRPPATPTHHPFPRGPDTRDFPVPFPTPCYAMVLPGRKSGFRAGSRSDSNREDINIGLRAGLGPPAPPRPQK